ncbi:peptidoglycan-binding protein [Streptomyces zhihengii]
MQYLPGLRRPAHRGRGVRACHHPLRAAGHRRHGGRFLGAASKRALQSHLNLRHDAGLLVDGDFGTASVKALQSYLNRMTGAGLPVDGSWGVATTSALQRALNLAKF